MKTLTEQFIEKIASKARYNNISGIQTVREFWGGQTNEEAKENCKQFIREKIGNKLDNFPEIEMTDENAEKIYAKIKMMKLG